MTKGLFDALKDKLPQLKWGLGPDDLNRLNVPPSAILVPSTDRFEIYNNRSKKAENVGVANPAPTEARSIKPPYSRVAGFVLHIWGKDYDQTELMIDAVVLALIEICGKSLELFPAGWDDDEDTEAAALKSVKRKYRLAFGTYIELGAEPETYVRLERALLDSATILNPTE